VSAADEELATALLWEAGTQGIEIQPSSDGVVLLAYFAESSDVERALAPLASARVEPVPVPEVDWVRSFREAFTAFDVGRFRVVPAWEASPDSGLVLRIDPARAFGTGTHETTRLCLLALERLAGEGPLGRVLDLGAGTGILAVAAIRLGARRATAADIDAESVDSVRHHAQLNGVELAVVRGDAGRPLRDRSFDVVLANLTAPLLVERASEITSLLAPGGRLVLSGLLSTQGEEVEAAYGALRRVARRDDGEWRVLILERLD
jgi:ribosomal protein L11 methyltransferase